MSYTWYCAIFNLWYMTCTPLYIRHTHCTCHKPGIGPYSTFNTYPVHFYTSEMSYAQYFDIFNRWYMAYTLLNIRHTPCTCRIRVIGRYSTVDTWLVHFFYIRYTSCTSRKRGIGPYSTIDTQLMHFYTSDIHPAHVVYTVLGYIQPVIHKLYTFIHQTCTLYMSDTRYWAIFNRWYMACTLLYIRYTPSTCRIRSIGPYSTGDT